MSSETARSSRCSACGLRYTGDHECPPEPRHHGDWEWEAEHYDEIAVRINQGGAAYMKRETLAQMFWAVVALVIIVVGVFLSGQYGPVGLGVAIVLAIGTVAVYSRSKIGQRWFAGRI